MTEEEIFSKLNSLLEEAKNSLTKDEIKTLFDTTRKRIREIEQKAVNRLLEGSKKNKSKPEDSSEKEQ